MTKVDQILLVLKTIDSILSEKESTAHIQQMDITEVTKLQKENTELRQSNEQLKDELERSRGKVLGFTLQKKLIDGKYEKWYAWKVINRKTRYVYIGDDLGKAKEKILAWKQKYGLMDGSENTKNAVSNTKGASNQVQQIFV